MLLNKLHDKMRTSEQLIYVFRQQITYSSIGITKLSNKFGHDMCLSAMYRKVLNSRKTPIYKS